VLRADMGTRCLTDHYGTRWNLGKSTRSGFSGHIALVGKCSNEMATDAGRRADESGTNAWRFRHGIGWTADLLPDSHSVSVFRKRRLWRLVCVGCSDKLPMRTLSPKVFPVRQTPRCCPASGVLICWSCGNLKSGLRVVSAGRLYCAPVVGIVRRTCL
jgi:hypothetical protein